jgi:hypothetical protein
VHWLSIAIVALIRDKHHVDGVAFRKTAAAACGILHVKYAGATRKCWGFRQAASGTLVAINDSG